MLARLVAGFARAGKVGPGCLQDQPESARGLPRSEQQRSALSHTPAAPPARPPPPRPTSLPCPLLRWSCSPCLQVTAEEYAEAQPDPIAPFSAPVAGAAQRGGSTHTAQRVRPRARSPAVAGLPDSPPPAFVPLLALPNKLCLPRSSTGYAKQDVPLPTHNPPPPPPSHPPTGHMNDDHADATAAMIKHYVGITGAWRPGRAAAARAAGAAPAGGPSPRPTAPPSALRASPRPLTFVCPPSPSRACSLQGHHPERRPPWHVCGVRPRQGPAQGVGVGCGRGKAGPPSWRAYAAEPRLIGRVGWGGWVGGCGGGGE